MYIYIRFSSKNKGNKGNDLNFQKLEMAEKTSRGDTVADAKGEQKEDSDAEVKAHCKTLTVHHSPSVF